MQRKLDEAIADKERVGAAQRMERRREYPRVRSGASVGNARTMREHWSLREYRLVSLSVVGRVSVVERVSVVTGRVLTGVIFSYRVCVVAGMC